MHRVEYGLDALIGRSREESEITGDMPAAVQQACLFVIAAVATLH